MKDIRINKTLQVYSSLFLFLFLLTHSSHAQIDPVRHLTLDEAVTIALEGSPSSIITKKNFESSAWNYQAFKSSLKPQVILNMNTPGFTRSINSTPQPDGTILFTEQNQAYTSANLDITQAILPTGGTVFLRSGLSRIDVFGANGYISWQTTPMLIGVRQPIFQFNSLHWMQRIEPLRYKIAERQMIEALEDLSTEVTGKFFDLCIADMRLKNEESNLSVNDSIFKISEGRYNVGKIAENDMLQSKLAWMNARVSVQNARMEYRLAFLELTTMLGFSDDIEIAPELPGMPPDFEVNTDFAVNQAMQNRSDVLSYEMRRLQAESNVAQARLNSRFNADISATYGLNQSGTTIQDAYTQPLNRQSVSVGLNIPILQWGKAKAETRGAEALRDASLAQIQLDQKRLMQQVEFQVLEYLQLKQQVEISAKSDTIAQRRFDVAKDRYLIGKIDITNLQIAQNEKNQAKAGYYEMLRRYWTAYYRLRKATLYDFVNGSLIQP